MFLRGALKDLEVESVFLRALSIAFSRGNADDSEHSWHRLDLSWIGPNRNALKQRRLTSVVLSDN
jgi:hypothetical protein